MGRSFRGRFGISSSRGTFKKMLKLGWKNNDGVYAGYVPKVSSWAFTIRKVTFCRKSSLRVRLKEPVPALNHRLPSPKWEYPKLTECLHRILIFFFFIKRKKEKKIEKVNSLVFTDL